MPRTALLVSTLALVVAPVAVACAGSPPTATTGTPDAARLATDDDVAAPALSLPSVQDQIARQLHDQVRGRWVVDCPSTAQIRPSTTFPCTARDRDGLAAIVEVSVVPSSGTFTWHVIEVRQGHAPDEQRTPAGG